MTQEYTPVAWQDETTSQQGTLINAERLNQMQTAHHYADGFEEVDAVPTADPGVSYHKIVYCTADSTFYRWDGTQWTKDIDDETKALLQQEIARATAAESELRGQLEDEHDARVDAEAAINDRITDETAELAQRIATEASTRYTADTALGTRITNETSARETADTGLGNRITAEATARAEADTALGGRIDTEQARAEAAEQANAQAIANTYTKAETDTLLGAKADVATTYSKTETDTLLGAKANASEVVKLAGNQTVDGVKTFNSQVITPIAGCVWAGYPQANKYRKIASINAGSVYATAEITDTSGRDAKVIIYFGAESAPTIKQVFCNATANNLVLAATYNNGAYEIYFKTGVAHNYSILINAYGRFRNGVMPTLYADSSAYNVDAVPGSSAEITLVSTVAYIDAYLPMVRTTGNQTIAGVKTYTGQIAFTSATKHILIASGVSDRTTPPASRIACDTTRIEDGGNKAIFTDYFQMETSGAKRYTRALYVNGEFKALSLEAGADNTAWATAPTRGYIADNTDDVATIGTLDAYSPMVRTTGNQTIGGTKTFTSGIVRTGGDVHNLIEDTTSKDITSGTVWYGGRIRYYDTNGVEIGRIFIRANANATSTLGIEVRNSDGTFKFISLGTGDVIA